MTTMIEARGLEKNFGKTRALDGLDLVTQSGQVAAVLGPNGAGKTTFVRAMATLVRLDGGTLRVAGHDVRDDAEAVRRVCSARAGGPRARARRPCLSVSGSKRMLTASFARTPAECGDDLIWPQA
jgi:ABC-type branched-subunit amino acid transport system ATPase component